MTADGNLLPDDGETELLWWNVVRPTCELKFYDLVERRTWYEYTIDLTNGVTTGGFTLQDKNTELVNEMGTVESSNHWRWRIDEAGDPTIWGRNIRVVDVVEALQRADPDQRFEKR
jgi:hypothetical protein